MTEYISNAKVAQPVEHYLGKNSKKVGVGSSNLPFGSIFLLPSSINIFAI